MQFFVHNPGIAVLLVLILALLGVLGWRLAHRPSPGPDTRIQRALSAAEVAKDAGRYRHTPGVAMGPGQVKMPGVVVKPQPSIPVPPPRAPYYSRLREDADRRIAAETTELAPITPEQIVADRNQLLRVAQPATPVSTDAPTELLDMSVAQLMAMIEAEAKTALIPKLGGVPVLPDLPDRRIHAELPDGSEVVRYERAGKWFHEGPGLRVRLTLGQAAILATSRGATVRSGVPGGGLFDLRVRKAREEQG
jgi:hypothetical protein